MSEAIWVAVIAGFFPLLGTIITVSLGNKKNRDRADERAEKQEKIAKEQTNLMLYRIDQLEKKQDKHNNLMERVFKLEKEEAVLEEEIESVRQHIEDLHR